jgi:hypothetical protein
MHVIADVSQIEKENKGSNSHYEKQMQLRENAMSLYNLDRSERVNETNFGRSG